MQFTEVPSLVSVLPGRKKRRASNVDAETRAAKASRVYIPSYVPAKPRKCKSHSSAGDKRLTMLPEAPAKHNNNSPRASSLVEVGIRQRHARDPAWQFDLLTVICKEGPPFLVSLLRKKTDHSPRIASTGKLERHASLVSTHRCKENHLVASQSNRSIERLESSCGFDRSSVLRVAVRS
ncbi:hypothetical protein KCU65_g146, partial [Aureobasidium melanogenum]